MIRARAKRFSKHYRVVVALLPVEFPIIWLDLFEVEVYGECDHFPKWPEDSGAKKNVRSRVNFHQNSSVFPLNAQPLKECPLSTHFPLFSLQSFIYPRSIFTSRHSRAAELAMRLRINGQMQQRRLHIVVATM